MGANDYNAGAYVDDLDLRLTRLQVQLSKPVWGVRNLSNDWTTGFVRQAVGRLKHQFHYQLSVAKGRPFRGAREHGQGDYTVGPLIEMRMQEYGEQVDMLKASTLSLDGGWERIAPQIERQIMLEQRRVWAKMLNHGHLITDWTGSFFFKDDTGNQKYANPKKKKLGKWYNMLKTQGAVALPTRIDSMLQLANEVRGIDGEYLGLNDQKKFLWLPTKKYRDGYKTMSVLEVVPANNGIASGGGNTSKVFQDAMPVEVPWLRSDVIILASTVPDEELSPFTNLRGVRGGDGSLDENTDPEEVGAGIPEFEVIIQDKTSDLYKDLAMVAYYKRHWRGYGLGSAHGLIASYDGLPTDADPNAPTIDYTTLPSGGFY